MSAATSPRCYCSGIFSCSHCTNALLDKPKVVLYGLLRDNEEWVVLGYGADPLEPITDPLAYYPATAAGLVAATLDIQGRKI